MKIVSRAAAASAIAIGRRDPDPHRHRDLRDGASRYLICPFFAAISPFLRSVLEERLPTERIFMPFCPPSLSFLKKYRFFSVSFLPIRYNSLSLRASLHGVPAIFFKKGVDKSVYS